MSALDLSYSACVIAPLSSAGFQIDQFLTDRGAVFIRRAADGDAGGEHGERCENEREAQDACH